MGAEVFHTDRRTGRWTGMTNLIVAFRNFATFMKVFPVYCLFPFDIYVEV